MVFDISMYMLEMPEEEKAMLVALYDQFVGEATDSVRKCRLNLNKAKLKQVLGVKSELNQLQQSYLQALELDSKPEKGERKIADDWIILINEQSPRDTVQQLLYLASLNETALQLSPDNFDIQMWQVKIYDQLGMSISFLSAYYEINLKSVQLESLGYLQFRHSLQYGAFESIFKPVLVKYKKYEMLNDRDIRMNLKQESFNESNFEIIENLCEFEAYLQKSYFNTVQKEVNRQYEIFKNCQQAQELIVEKQIEEPAAVDSLTYTQDLNVVLDKYSMPKVQPHVVLPGEQPSTFADVMLSEILEGDDVLAAFKNSRFTNYKRGLYNAMGTYEDPATLKLTFNLTKAIQQLYKKEKPEFSAQEPHFAAICDLAVQLMPLEKGQL